MESVPPSSNGYQINFNLLTQKLKELAIEKRMTQVELAKGITTRDHLNKILNGKRNPSLELLYQLCNRLEVDIKTVLEQCHFVEFDNTQKIMHDMKECLTVFDFDRLEELVQQHADHIDFQFGMGKQYILKAKGVVLMKKYKKYEEALAYLDESLILFSNTDNDFIHSSNLIYTGQELSAYTHKSICLYELGRTEEAIDFLASLLINRIPYYDTTEIRLVLRAFYYLSSFLYRSDRYDEAILASTHGIKMAKSKFTFIYLGDFNRVIGDSYYKLDKLDLAKDHFKQAANLYNIFELTHFHSLLVEHCNAININITD